MDRKQAHKKWEVAISEFITASGPEWKVTRIFPELTIAETKVFTTKKEAIRQYEEWLR